MCIDRGGGCCCCCGGGSDEEDDEKNAPCLLVAPTGLVNGVVCIAATPDTAVAYVGGGSVGGCAAAAADRCVSIPPVVVRVGSFRGVDTADGLPLFDAVLALVEIKGKGRGVIRFDGRPAATSACAWKSNCACSGEMKSSSSGSK